LLGHTAFQSPLLIFCSRACSAAQCACPAAATAAAHGVQGQGRLSSKALWSTIGGCMRAYACKPSASLSACAHVRTRTHTQFCLGVSSKHLSDSCAHMYRCTGARGCYGSVWRCCAWPCPPCPHAPAPPCTAAPLCCCASALQRWPGAYVRSRWRCGAATMTWRAG